ncbi:hypothetical protein POM88_002516 [Heracleum sosnowskyi]|uniref:Uncharacterized protein n=1 Tax=Heracleum sosnowskyi TaxID=360622 RepID=A0AAD8JHT5_9APIA|nr:hypothetical protein POM88_002516 [Heracleum sosnowskyi]
MTYNEHKLEPGSVGIRIEYQARDGYPHFKVTDDSQLMFYIELKKKEFDFTKFPLCLANEMISIQPFSTSSNLLRSTGPAGAPKLLCFEATQSEDVASNIVYEESLGTVSDVVANYVDFVELIAGQIVVVDEVADNYVEEN